MEEQYKHLMEHEEAIIKDLNFKKRPKVLYGKDARDYLKEFEPKTKNVNGYFSYEPVKPNNYEETGVVCVVKNSIATLAHELRHAKQYETNKNMVGVPKILYKWFYIYHPLEQDAFRYALNYLKSINLIEDCKDYKKTIFKAGATTPVNIILASIIIFNGALLLSNVVKEIMY